MKPASVHIGVPRSRFPWAIASLVVLSAGIGFLWAQSKGKSLSVQVRQSQLRETPSFLGKVVCPVNYADPLVVIGEQPGWFQVNAGDRSGWIAASAVSTKKIVLNADAAAAPTSASTEEIVVAGKGFNQQLESSYRSGHDEDYAWIDRMEKMEVTRDEIARFAQDGSLRMTGGAR